MAATVSPRCICNEYSDERTSASDGSSDSAYSICSVACTKLLQLYSKALYSECNDGSPGLTCCIRAKTFSMRGHWAVSEYIRPTYPRNSSCLVSYSSVGLTRARNT